MPHQCVHCGEFYPAGSRALLEGCGKCGGHFFFYVRDDQVQKVRENPIEIPEPERKKIEKDIRDIAGITDEDMPVILDIESVRELQGKENSRLIWLSFLVRKGLLCINWKKENISLILLLH